MSVSRSFAAFEAGEGVDAGQRVERVLILLERDAIVAGALSAIALILLVSIIAFWSAFACGA